MNSVFTAAGIETRVVYRFDYTDPNIEWADAIVTTGGDGTFLLAASRILDRNKPLIGFNSDPTRSKGQLCLPQKYSVEVQEAIDKLLKVSTVIRTDTYCTVFTVCFFISRITKSLSGMHFITFLSGEIPLDIPQEDSSHVNWR